MDLSSVTSLFTSISIDWLILAAVIALSFFDSMRAGTARSIALALAFPFAYLLLHFVEGAQLVGSISTQFPSTSAQALFAFLLLAIGFFLLYRMTDTFGSDGGFIQSAAAAFGLAVMLVLFWQLIPAFSSLHNEGAQLRAVFSEAYRFWWFVVALVALAFSRS